VLRGYEITSRDDTRCKCEDARQYTSFPDLVKIPAGIFAEIYEGILPQRPPLFRTLGVLRSLMVQERGYWAIRASIPVVQGKTNEVPFPSFLAPSPAKEIRAGIPCWPLQESVCCGSHAVACAGVWDGTLPFRTSGFDVDALKSSARSASPGIVSLPMIVWCDGNVVARTPAMQRLSGSCVATCYGSVKA